MPMGFMLEPSNANCNNRLMQAETEPEGVT